MVDAASDAGLDAVGFADHANVSSRESIRESKLEFAFNLDLTYERRRELIQRLRSERDIDIYDAVEMDYHQEDEEEIREFLEEADFQYVIGSVHEIDGVNVHMPGPFQNRTAHERRKVVREYFDRLEALVRSELFEVAAHPDIIERNEALRGIPEESDYRRMAEALDDSRTVAEVNAGRIDQDYGRFHPKTEFLEVLLEYDLPVTVGSDSHNPSRLRDRIPTLRAMFADRGLDPISPFEV